jgi:hypothetical protein
MRAIGAMTCTSYRSNRIIAPIASSLAFTALTAHRERCLSGLDFTSSNAVIAGPFNT